MTDPAGESNAEVLPGGVAGLPFLKPVFQICDCTFSHGHASLSKCGKDQINGALIPSLLKRHGVIEGYSLPRELAIRGTISGRIAPFPIAALGATLSRAARARHRTSSLSPEPLEGLSRVGSGLPPG